MDTGVVAQFPTRVPVVRAEGQTTDGSGRTPEHSSTETSDAGTFPLSSGGLNDSVVSTRRTRTPVDGATGPGSWWRASLNTHSQGTKRG